MRRALAALVLLAASSAAAHIEVPRSLWDLSRDADLIAVATVARRHEGVFRPTDYLAAVEAGERTLQPSGGQPGQWARLRVDQVVAGPALAEVDVRLGLFDPADLSPGERVLVFLTRHGSTWLVEGGRYGALHPRPEELPLFVERVRSARTLLVRGGVTPAERLEWLLATAGPRATRWQGLWRLSVDLMPPDRALPPLTPAQLDRLARAFIAEPSTDETLPMMLELLQPVKDPRLDAAVVRALDEALAHGDAFRDQLHEALERGLRRFTGEAQAHALVPPFVNVDQPDRAGLEAAWKRAKAQLGLPGR